MKRLCLVFALVAGCGTAARKEVGSSATVALPKVKPEATLAFDEGVRLLGQGKPDAAREAFERATRADGSLFEGWHNLGTCHARLSRWDDAIAAFERALKIQPGSRATALALVEAYRVAEKYNEADRLLSRWRNERPEDARLTLIHAELLAAAGRAWDALELVRGLLAKNSRDAAAFAAMGRIYRGENKLGLAESALRRAIELGQEKKAGNRNDDDKQAGDKQVAAAAQADLGQVLLLQGRDQDAFAAFDRATEMDPKATLPRLYRATLFLDCGDYERAEKELEKASMLSPDDPDIQVALGVAARGRKNFEGARRAYEKALSLRPDYPPALFNLGLLLMDHLGDKKGARELFLLYRKVAPDRDGGKQKKAEALSRLKELPKEG